MKPKWKKADAGGYCNVDVDYFIWHECDDIKKGDNLYCQNGNEVTCPKCGRTFRVVTMVRLQEKVVEEPLRGTADFLQATFDIKE